MRSAAATPAVAALALLAAVLGAPAAADTPAIEPGDYVEVDGTGCTLAFVFDGTGGNAGKVYFLTAAHCVERTGQRAWTDDGGEFGTVRLVGNAGVTAQDYAFIEVDEAKEALVRAGVAGSPQWPTGSTVSGETAAGDVLQQSGWGTAFSFTTPTREWRQGYLTSDTPQVWRFAGAMDFGDSGGPLVHVETGKALGIESRVCIGVCTDEGPTVEGILAKAAARNFGVQLRTV
jgi:hypothetical protein